jgi:hypothetical protein
MKHGTKVLFTKVDDITFILEFTSGELKYYFNDWGDVVNVVFRGNEITGYNESFYDETDKEFLWVGRFTFGPGLLPWNFYNNNNRFISQIEIKGKNRIQITCSKNEPEINYCAHGLEY